MNIINITPVKSTTNDLSSIRRDALSLVGDIRSAEAKFADVMTNLETAGIRIARTADMSDIQYLGAVAVELTEEIAKQNRIEDLAATKRQVDLVTTSTAPTSKFAKFLNRAAQVIG